MTQPASEGGAYKPDTFIKPGANLQALAWLIILGLPMLMVFMVLHKAEKAETSQTRPTVQQERPAH